MQCADFEPRLQELLDAGGSPPFDHVLADPMLASHAAECAACRQLLAAMVAVVGETAAMPVAACSANLTSRVLQQMQSPPRRRVLPLRLALAAAAALALALPMWGWLASRPTPHAEHTTHTAAASASAPTSASAPAQPQQTQPQLAQPHLSEPWSLVPGVADFSAGPNQDLSTDLNGWGNDVREGLAPVTRSTAGTLESLWQAISPAEDSRS